MPVTFQVYSRRGCHLCELLLEQLEPLLRGTGEIQLRDVDTREDWCEQYGDRVPVVCIDDRTLCEYRLDRQAVLRELDAAETRGNG